MRILALDIGGLTQDILLFDSSQGIENCVKLIMPSPTAILAQRIRAATKAKHPIFFTGVNMGGGPSRKALNDHLKAGLEACSTPEAAETFDDDIEAVKKMGVRIINNGESSPDAQTIETRDLNMAAIKQALEAFNIDTSLDGVAVAVLDHGAAPPEISDRLFRFQHLRETIEKNPDIFSFAYLKQEIAEHLTRMKAVAQSCPEGLPVLLMDTPVAAAIGASEDGQVAKNHHKVIINVGNFHTLAFHLEGDTILGVFEHHTGILNRAKIDEMVRQLVCGELSNEAVFADNGHGCVIRERRSEIPFVAVTGPRRRMMQESSLNPCFAAPFGDMMLTGSFGLIRAFGRRKPEWKNEIEKAMGQ